MIILYLDSLFNNVPFFLGINIISFALKTYILSKLLIHGFKSTAARKSWFLLILVLISSMMSDSVWIYKLIGTTFFHTMDYRPYLFWLRITWGFFAIQYQALALFIENLTSESPHFNLRQKFFIFVSSAFCFFSIGLAFFNFDCPHTNLRPALEFDVRIIENIYLLCLLIPLGILVTLWNLRKKLVPRIIKEQINWLILLLVIPTWFFDLIQMFPLAISPSWTTHSYSAECICTILMTCALYYCARKIIALRFLNLKGHVESTARFSFIDGFKDVLEQLSHTTSTSELRHITQTLFKEAFGIPLNKTKLYLRKTQPTVAQGYSGQANNAYVDTKPTTLVEAFLTTHDNVVCERIQDLKILIYDEIAFNNFYDKNTSNEILLRFLDTINADIFVPIYDKNNMVAYIIVERDARPKNLYGNVEHDEMLVFASYLGNIINLLQSRNLKALIQQEKQLKDELYHKHQEINQYKESIRSFLRTSKQKEIGILFYKNRQFVFGNKAAKELIHININAQQGHPLTKELKTVARQVQDYKAPYSSFAKDKHGDTIILSGVPNLEQNNVIITICYPEISDIIKQQINLLKDPTEWDYLLYLETTESGKLVNQLIPGSGETLLNFKVTLLKTALNKKAILLDMPEEDLMSTVEILHHINLRQNLHILKLHAPSRNSDTAIKLFGINPLFGMQQPEKPLLEHLNKTGTLFIQNIHFLDLETQGYLAEFIRYGLYRMFKSDQRIASQVRIICSTTQNLQTLVHEGTFSAELYNELNAMTLSMPSLLTLPEEELNRLADGFIEQALETDDLKNLLTLSDPERNKLALHRPVSLQELKDKVQSMLMRKSKKNQIYHETKFDPAYQLSDPQLVEAARLGKQALRDSKTMTMLWNKFKSQAKISTFLGVNRSSVNRRCKEYNLE